MESYQLAIIYKVRIYPLNYNDPCGTYLVFAVATLALLWITLFPIFMTGTAVRITADILLPTPTSAEYRACPACVMSENVVNG